MLSSLQLKEIVAEARPIIERQLDDADVIAGIRDMVSANGGDWSSLKALIKAQIQDERDESGDGKRVRKILDKADFSTGYADMLGWSKMNEENNIPARSYAEEKGRSDADPKLIETVAAGMQTEVGHKALVTALDIMIEREEADELTDNQSQPVPADQHVAATAAQDDVGATASSTNSPDGRPEGQAMTSLEPHEMDRHAVTAGETAPNSNSQPTKGESDAKSAHHSVSEKSLNDRRRQDAAQAERQQPTGNQNAPAESAADKISVTNSNSRLLPAENSAGEASSASQAQASPATHSDDDIPAFIKKQYVLRPHCQHPELCRSRTRDHCHSCKVAMSEREAVEA